MDAVFTKVGFDVFDRLSLVNLDHSRFMLLPREGEMTAGGAIVRQSFQV